MELSELLTAGGAAAIIIILLQAIRPALGLSAAAWDRFGAVLAIGLGIIIVSAGNLALGSPQPLLEAALTGLLAGASASGLYQAGKHAVTEPLAERLTQPPATDYDAGAIRGSDEPGGPA